MTSLKLRNSIARFVRRMPLLFKLLYYAYRFMQPKYSVGVVGVLWNDKNQVLLVEHVFHPKLPWGLSGGWVNNNEEPSHAVVREYQEELGLIIDVVDIIMVEKSQYNHLDIAYLCQTKDYHISTLSNELLTYQWYDVNHLPPLHSFHYNAIHKSSTMREYYESFK